MSKIRLTEKEVWKLSISKFQLLEALQELTSNRFIDNKKKIAQYKGSIGNSHFNIKENPAIAKLSSVSGPLNKTTFTGNLEDTSTGVRLHIKGQQYGFNVLSTLIGVVLIGWIILSILEFTFFNISIALSVIVLIEVLMIRGFNMEIREGMKKLKMRLEEIEKAHA